MIQKITEAGLAARVAAELAGNRLELQTMVLGSGQYANDDEAKAATALKQFEVRIPIESERQGLTPQQRIIEALVPIEVGGFDLLEVGLEDSNNVLYAYATVPLKRLESSNDGTNRLTLEFVLVDTNANDVMVIIDDSAVYATRQFVNDELTRLRSRSHINHTVSGNISTLNLIRLPFSDEFQAGDWYSHSITLALDLVLEKILNTFYEIRITLTGCLDAVDYKTFCVNALENDETSLNRSLKLHYQALSQGQPADLLAQVKIVRYKSFASSSDDADNVEQVVAINLAVQSIRL